MAGHTPGPWAVFDDEIVVAGTDQHLFSVPLEDGMNPTEWQENLRLIAAAPDLLEAARAFLAQWALVKPAIDGAFTLAYVHGGRYTGPTLTAQLDQLEAAITKAEGRS